jgi:hypothetical protein
MLLQAKDDVLHKPFTPVERGKLYCELIGSLTISERELAKRLGIHHNSLRLYAAPYAHKREFPDDVWAAFERGEIAVSNMERIL